MDTINFRTDALESYWLLVRHLSAEAKLELASRLIDSLKPGNEKKNKDEKAWKKLYGAWANDNETAEEMIDRIREARLFNRKTEPFD